MKVIDNQKSITSCVRHLFLKRVQGVDVLEDLDGDFLPGGRLQALDHVAEGALPKEVQDVVVR